MKGTLSDDFNKMNHQQESSHPVYNHEGLTNTPPVLTLEDSLINLSRYEVILNLFEEFGMSPMGNADIVQQILMVAIGIEEGDGSKEILVGVNNETFSVYSSHVNVARMVILTHIIDDIFDIYENQRQIRNNILAIIEEYYTLYSDKESPASISDLHESLFWDIFDSLNKYSYIDKFGNTINIDIDQIKDILHKAPSDRHRIIIKLNLLKIIINGLIVTENINYQINSQNGQSKIDPHREQIILMGVYKFLYLTDIASVNRVNALRENGVPSERRILPFEARSSEASAVLNAFDGLVLNPNYNPYFTEFFDGILGPMVFLNNFIKEKNENLFEFIERNSRQERKYEDPPNFIEYRAFINAHWFEVKDILVSVQIDSYIKRKLMQLCVGYYLMLLPASQSDHSFDNFYHELPVGNTNRKIIRDLRPLKHVYAKIVNEIIANKWITREEIVSTLKVLTNSQTGDLSKES